MNKDDIQVNYIGDKRYLNFNRVKDIAVDVIRNYWRLSGSPPEEFKIDINVVSDKKIRDINRRYLNRDYPTDVIAFSLNEGELVPGESVPLLGQVIISRDSAKRQAPEYGHSVREEMEILLIHGLLHVVGWKEGCEIQRCQKTIKKNFQART